MTLWVQNGILFSIGKEKKPDPVSERKENENECVLYRLWQRGLL